jgi:hypothetical protein
MRYIPIILDMLIFRREIPKNGFPGGGVLSVVRRVETGLGLAMSDDMVLKDGRVGGNAWFDIPSGVVADGFLSCLLRNIVCLSGFEGYTHHIGLVVSKITWLDITVRYICLYSTIILTIQALCIAFPKCRLSFGDVNVN